MFTSRCVTSMFTSMCVTRIRSSLKHWVGGTGQLLPYRRNSSVMKMYPHWKCQWENTYFKRVD